jgi:peroxiredoxin
MGINRSTFIIDPEGNVARAMMGIRPAGHASAVLNALYPDAGAQGDSGDDAAPAA